MSVLKTTVFVGFLLFALFHISHAFCWKKTKEPGMTHCKDDVDEEWHPVGSTWKNKWCARCSCRADSMDCCDESPRAVFEGCSLKLDYETCTYKLVRHNKRIPCGTAEK